MQRTTELLDLGDYSPATKKLYLTELRYLFAYYADVRPSQISQEMTLSYLIYLTKTLGCSRVKCKMAAQSFSFFFKHALNKSYKIPSVLYPSHRHKLPAVISVEEMKTIIDSVKNPKHQMVLALMYSTGMRISEASNLKIKDIDSKLMRIKIVDGKGKKDRFVPLSILILEKLRTYFKLYQPVTYLFNGQVKGNNFTTRSIQHFFQKALHKNELDNKNYSVHTIRHSFATHLLDNGTDLKSIQHLMGHANIAQTTQYLHLSPKRIASIANPYDLLMQENSLPTTKQKI